MANKKNINNDSVWTLIIVPKDEPALTTSPCFNTYKGIFDYLESDESLILKEIDLKELDEDGFTETEHLYLIIQNNPICD